jgi:hypothetical protein
VEKARGFFGEALAVWGGEERAASGAGLDFPARPAAQAEVERLRRAGP